MLRLILIVAFALPSLAAAESFRAHTQTPIEIDSAGTDDGLSAETRKELEKLKRQLSADIRKVLRAPVFRGAQTAVKIYVPSVDQLLFEKDAHALLNPASNVKLFSTAAALDALGPDYRYRTRLLGPSPVDGVVPGDVFLLGEYDPTLFPYAFDKLVNELKERGVTRISGDIMLDGESKRDVLMERSIRFEVRGTSSGEPATVKVLPESAHVELETDVRTRRGRGRLSISTERIEDANFPKLKVKISGTIKRGRMRAFRRRVVSRAHFTGEVLKAKLAAKGIEVRGKVVSTTFSEYLAASSLTFLPIELAARKSRPLSGIIASVNKRSINWLADGVVNTAAARVYGGEPTMAKGTRLMRAWLKRNSNVDTERMVVDTGSGLSYRTKINSNQIMAVLTAAGGWDNAKLTDKQRAFQRSLAIGGKDGTLRRRYRGSDSAGHVHGKTGTLTRVIALSGAVKSDEGATILFTLVTNGHREYARHRVRLEHDRIVKLLHGYSEDVAIVRDDFVPPLLDE